MPWTLVVLLLVAAPLGIFRASFSAEPTAADPRLSRLERDNAELKKRLASLDDQLHMLRQKLPRSAPAEPGPLGVLQRWPVPDSLSFAGEEVPVGDPEVHVRIEQEWARYLVNRHWLISWLRRSRDVFPVLESKLAAAGLPEDLKYVVVVESGLRARAYSPAGAVGWWQFIRGTGEHYGLERNSWKDDRRNLESSTDAAIAYLSEMHEEFGSWPLVLAGFNAGERRVRAAIAEQGTRNYYEMILPSETEAYWFRAVVIKEFLSHPQRYDLQLPDDGWKPTSTARVRFRVDSKRLDLKEIVALTGLSYRRLKELNPQWRRSWLPRGGHEVTLPQASVEAFLKAYPRAQTVGTRSAVLADEPRASGLSAPESSTSPRP